MTVNESNVNVNLKMKDELADKARVSSGVTNRNNASNRVSPSNAGASATDAKNTNDLSVERAARAQAFRNTRNTQQLPVPYKSDTSGDNTNVSYDEDAPTLYDDNDEDEDAPTPSEFSMSLSHSKSNSNTSP